MSEVSLGVGIGLACALLSALGTNLAFLFKHKGALAAPDVDMRHPVRSAVDLFRSRWWSIGWGVAAAAFALHVAALSLAPISIGQAVLAGGLVFLAVLAERFFGFELGGRQWIGIGLVAVSLTLLTLTGGGGGGGAHSGYSLAGMILFEGVAVGVGTLLICSHMIDRIRAQPGVLLGIAAGLGFGISDVAIKALSGDLGSGPIGLLSPWSVIIVTAAIFSFYASARSLQIGDGVAVIAVTSVAANLSTIVAGLAVFGDRLGDDVLVVGVRLAAFALILVGAALIPAPVRACEALEDGHAVRNRATTTHRSQPRASASRRDRTATPARSPRGRHRQAATARLEPELDRLVGESHFRRLVLDLEEVRFINSTGVGALLSIRERTRSLEIGMRLINVPDAIQRVLEQGASTRRSRTQPPNRCGSGRTSRRRARHRHRLPTRSRAASCRGRRGAGHLDRPRLEFIDPGGARLRPAPRVAPTRSCRRRANGLRARSRRSIRQRSRAGARGRR